MDYRRYCIQYLVIALFLPVMASAECVEWWLCNYVTPENMPNSRYLPLDTMDLPFAWNEIEVDAPVGTRALVCLEGEMPAGPVPGCRQATRGADINSLLVPPKVPFFDGEQIQFSETRRNFDPRAIRKRIRDSAIEYDDLRGRNPR